MDGVAGVEELEEEVGTDSIDWVRAEPELLEVRGLDAKVPELDSGLLVVTGAVAAVAVVVAVEGPTDTRRWAGRGILAIVAAILDTALDSVRMEASE